MFHSIVVNINSIAVKRLYREAKELREDQTAEYFAQPLDVRTTQLVIPLSWEQSINNCTYFRTISLNGTSQCAVRPTQTSQVVYITDESFCRLSTRWNRHLSLCLPLMAASKLTRRYVWAFLATTLSHGNLPGQFAPLSWPSSASCQLKAWVQSDHLVYHNCSLVLIHVIYY